MKCFPIPKSAKPMIAMVMPVSIRIWVAVVVQGQADSRMPLAIFLVIFSAVAVAVRVVGRKFIAVPIFAIT